MRLMLEPGEDIAALVRGAIGESRVVVIPATLDALAMAQAKAAMEPLAVELAPATRVNAVVLAEHADPADVDAAVAFLEQARSTTGQLIEIR
ncbi:Rossmann fold domain-containing protein [Sphingomonas sp. 4RDLI-65]|uniref:Rossmann fold domain-containing protein n=1 Tax=Sphingomonas sp. 4RDLI-65 TaxID=3111641 RepID=UPI003C16DA82